jgi:hypothetical protein
MTMDLLRLDISRFYPISPELVVRAYLACQKQGISLTTLQDRLKALVAETTVDATVASLIESDEISGEKTLKLTSTGKVSAAKLLGQDAKGNWETIKSKRLPLMALGLDPDDPNVRKKFKTADTLKAATFMIVFGLPKEVASNLKAALSEIVWLILRGGLPDVVGRGPFPTIDKPGHVERTLIAGLAGANAKTITEATDKLIAKAISAEKTGIEALRERLIAIGIEQAQKNTAPKAVLTKAAPVKAPKGKDNFAFHVIQVARKLSTPPFQGRVAIAQVYDLYGKLYPDAGTLASFKERLINSAKNKEIDLGRLDLPERMSNDLRKRSETRWDREEVHFIITDWN